MTDRQKIADLMAARSTSLRAAAIDWLIANDPNGCYTDEEHTAEWGEPLKLMQALRLVIDQNSAEALNTLPCALEDVLAYVDAQSLVANYGDEIRKAWAGQDLKALAALDYVHFINNGKTP